MIYIHICTDTCITYIYSNLLHLEPKKWALNLEGVKKVRPFDSPEAEELQGSLSTRGGALDLLIQPRPIHELSKVKVTNCLFSSRSRFKAFPSPVISTNIKTCPLRRMQTQQQILKYDSLLSLILNNWFSFSAGSLRIYTISSSFLFSPFQNPWHFNLFEALF